MLKKGTPIRSSKSIEDDYLRAMNKMFRYIIVTVRGELVPFLKSKESEYLIKAADMTTDKIHFDLEMLFSKIDNQFGGLLIESYARSIASEMVEKTNRDSKKKMGRALKTVSEVALASVISNEGLEDYVQESIAQNTRLIKNVSEDYLSKVRTIVSNGVMSGARYNEIAKELLKNDKSLGNRAKTIARTETKKINSQISIRRSAALGITKGIYVTVNDGTRVRPCHRELEGKEFELTKGAWSKTCQKYIIPGITDINCRCSYRPVIEV
jgi:SPP1 gp7 family putative phage head morphogenesis protein